MREGKYAKRLGVGAAIFLTSVIEYITAELLELAGNAAKDNKRCRIIPRHIMLAIKNDDELNELLKSVILPSAGVQPHINAMLLPSRYNKSTWSQNNTHNAVTQEY